MKSGQGLRETLLAGICALSRVPEHIKVKRYCAEADLPSWLAQWPEKKAPSDPRGVALNAILTAICCVKLADAKEKLKQMRGR